MDANGAAGAPTALENEGGKASDQDAPQDTDVPASPGSPPSPATGGVLHRPTTGTATGRRSPGMRPAMVVVGLAALIVVLFGVTAALTGNNAPSPSPGSERSTAVPGTGLRAIPAASALTSITQPGLPPANIVDALRVPAGARVVSHANTAAGIGQYDEQVVLSAHASQAALITFYKTSLAHAGWHIDSVGPAPQHAGLEVLAGKGGTDGWSWEVGAIVAPTTFAAVSPGSTSAGGGQDVTNLTIRLIQVPDQD